MIWWLACMPEQESVPVEETGEAILRAPLQFRFPLTDPLLFTQKIGVDHDPEVYEGAGAVICTDYIGRTFPWCYDEHDGSDFMLDGGFDAMDAGSTPILAAYPGVVVETQDGNYDRCHATVNGVDCDGNPMAANYVILEHTGGYRTLYWHMKSGSVAVEVGQEVACGESLGLVGSSGNSSGPHLHFELQDSEEVVIDPYSGPYSQEETWWAEQGEPEAFPGIDCAADL
jgi:murein DD-endopeptidase MepM/ murein hydrolase activator NlpD